MPSVLSGVARVLDLGCQFDNYNTSKTEEEADALALYSDFRLVGQDLQKAMESFTATDVRHEQLRAAFKSMGSLTKTTDVSQ